MEAAAAEAALAHVSGPISRNFVDESADAFYARQPHVEPPRLIRAPCEHIREMLADKRPLVRAGRFYAAKAVAVRHTNIIHIWTAHALFRKDCMGIGLL